MSYGNRNYGGGGRGFAGSKPVEVGKEYDVQITEISRKGDGIARVQGFVVFVKGGKMGQKTKTKVTQVGDRFASAEVAASATQPEATETPASVPEEEKPKLQDYDSKKETPTS